jgi:MoxR-like ATPase
MNTLSPWQAEDAWSTLQALRSEICKAIIGQETVVDQVLIALIGAGHVLIEGVPGLT